jgi:hypothetical protein
LLFLALSCGAAAQSFAEFHPDQHFRARGAKAAEAGKSKVAVEDFLRAARYADKPSQLALALAYWTGEGVAVDKPTGYAWADLAAERGVPSFLAVRERMWSELTPEEQARAKDVGAKLAAEYADAVAKPRLESRLKRGARQKTGSRTGSSVHSTGVASIDPAARAAVASHMYSSILGNVGPNAVGDFKTNMISLLGRAMTAASSYSTEGYYDPANWDPKFYWKAQDAPWRDLPEGTVLVGPLSKKQ